MDEMELTEVLGALRIEIRDLRQRVEWLERTMKYAGEICTWPEETYAVHLGHQHLWKPLPLQEAK